METVKGPDSYEERIERMVNQYQLPLLKLCYAYLHDVELAKDAVQETFIKAYRNLSGFKESSSEKTWLTRIAINTCKDYRRSAWFRHVDRARALDELPPQLVSVEPEDHSLTLMVMDLPDRLKQVILLYYYQGLTMLETAEALGTSQTTVHRRLKKAEELLKVSLEGGVAYEG